MLEIFKNIINGAKLVLQELEEEKAEREADRALESTKLTPIEDEK